MLGTVLAVEPDALQIHLDGGADAHKRGRAISIPVNSYQSFDHGYATTIHKSQGATVDRTFVMASGTMDRHLTYVAMTRHRDHVRLYAGCDELKDMKVLSGSMSRSGAKETTLDYTSTFAERRGLAEEFGVASEIAVVLSPGRAGERQALRSGAGEERARSAAALQPPAADEGQRSGQVERTVEKVEPLVPALRKYSRSIEDVAREKAKPDLERAMATVRSVGRNVYADPEDVAVKLRAAIVDKGADGEALARSVAERPEQFGELRGKAGLLGENKERNAARHYAKALSNHVAAAGRTWTRRLEAERGSETWQREKRDVVEVPGLTRRTEGILKQLDTLPQAEKQKFLEWLSGTSEGKQALEEAKTVAKALEQRFGSVDARDLKMENMRLGPELSTKLDRIKDVARIVDRAQRAELTRKYELTRGLKKGLGLRM